MYWAMVETATMVVATTGTEAPNMGATKKEAISANNALMNNAFNDNLIGDGELVVS